MTGIQSTSNTYLLLCLIFQNILKHYDEEKEGFDVLCQALTHMTSMAQHINEMKRKHEHAVRIQEIQSQLLEYDGADLTTLGDLIIEVSLRQIIFFSLFTNCFFLFIYYSWNIL